MIKFKWRKWNRVIHRDFGYFFFGMTLIYGLSGIVLNHMNDFNPNYIIRTWDVETSVTSETGVLSDEEMMLILESLEVEDDYKKHYFPDESTMKVFLKGGSLTLNTVTGKGILETIKRRPLFYHVNFLHYNPGKWWMYFSDVYASALILLAITGLFILRGKNGIKGRGAWLTLAGIIIPIIFLIFYL